MVSGMTRSTIFISHANPEDNEFARWLASKLTLAGYVVWCDLDRLKGGDLFWNEVESCLRNDAIRLVAVVSEASYSKDGVRNEWDLGITLEKQIPGFVVPVRIDAFDFSKLPITIHRKHVIDFHRGWHDGLAKLLDTFVEDRVPRKGDADPATAREWLPHQAADAVTWIDRPETLESNWLPIVSLPPAIETTRIQSGAREIAETSTNRKLPWFELSDRIVGFASRAELIALFKDSVPLVVLNAIDTETFITDGVSWGAERVTAFDAQNRVAHLVRQAWDLRMESLKLKAYELSGRRFVWYMPSGLLANNRVEFVEATGKRRKRQLTGHSEKYKVKWHYGATMQVALGDPRHLELRAHIIFTGADGDPVSSTLRMHQLRRSFCRSWWNDRWRGFMRAYLAFIANGTDTIILPVGDGRAISVGAAPLTFHSPKSLSDAAELMEDEEVVLEPVADFSEFDEDDPDGNDMEPPGGDAP
jgi:hypothetical protein